jgi:uncharacterized membrane protein (UPF0136 family)
MTPWIIMIYAILIAVGGIMGYAKAKSLPSLFAGVGAGLFLIGSAVAMMKGSYQTGWWIALLVTIALLLRFGSSAVANGFKMMPGGMVIILSLIVLVVLITNRGR